MGEARKEGGGSASRGGLVEGGWWLDTVAGRRGKRAQVLKWGGPQVGESPISVLVFFFLVQRRFSPPPALLLLRQLITCQLSEAPSETQETWKEL